METVQLQCGHCQKVIAIRAEHMGSQVRCPHCQQVVQTPPRAAVPAPAPTAAAPQMEIPQPESIFAGPEASDSLMEGDPPLPKVEMPASNGTFGASTAPAASAAEPGGAVDFSQFKKKPVFDKGVIPLLMLIFLVPYALTTTAFILYLLFAQPKAPHPFDYLPDPASGKDKGAPRPARMQPKPDQPLAEHQKTTIGKPIKAGDLEITPLRVILTKDGTGGDLKLILRAKNVSKNIKFQPVSGYYFHRTKGGSDPYAFVESANGSVARIEAFDLGFHKSTKADDAAVGDALLSPGEEVTIALTTDLKYHDKHVPNIDRSKDESYTWRVQVRRGFVKVDGKDISATTVIGVDFANAEIEREKKS